MNNNSKLGQTLSALPNFTMLNAGIDRVNVRTEDFAVSSSLPFQVDPFSKKAGQAKAEQTPLFRLNSGEYVLGKKATLNKEHFQLTIVEGGLMLFNMNPSKILYGQQSYKLVSTAAELQQAAHIVEAEAREYGVSFDFKTSTAWRVDLTKQAEMPRLFSDYRPAFDHMSLKYAKGDSLVHGVQTFQYNTTKQQHLLQFYDKWHEMNKAQRIKYMLSSPFMRAEIRALDGAMVRKLVKCSTPADLIAAGPEAWNDAYEHYLKTKLFRSQQQQGTIDFTPKALRNLIDVLANMSTSDRKNGLVQKTVRQMGIKQVIEQFGVDNFLSYFEPYLNERTLRRQRVELLKSAEITHRHWEKIKIVELVNELQMAFAA